MKACGKLALAAVVMTLCAMQAQGDAIQVTAKFTGVSPGLGVTVATTSGISGGYDGGTTAGVFNFSSVSFAGDGVDDGLDLSLSAVQEQLQAGFKGFCIDLTHTISQNTTHTWNLVPLTGVTNNGTPISQTTATAITYLWGSHFGDIDDGIGNQANDAATFQIALWKVIYGSNVSFSGLNDSILNTAQNWADAAKASNGFTAPVYALVDVTNPITQGIAITIVGGGAPPPVVPLPAAVWSGMSMLGALGVGAAIRKKLRRA